MACAHVLGCSIKSPPWSTICRQTQATCSRYISPHVEDRGSVVAVGFGCDDWWTLRGRMYGGDALVYDEETDMHVDGKLKLELTAGMPERDGLGCMSVSIQSDAIQSSSS